MFFVWFRVFRGSEIFEGFEPRNTRKDTKGGEGKGSVERSGDGRYLEVGDGGGGMRTRIGLRMR